MTYLARMLTHSVSVERLSSSNDKESYSSQATIDGLLQPQDSESSVLSGQAVGQSYRLFTKRDADIQITDRITVDGETYIVSALQDHNYSNFLKHKEWIVEKEGTK